jgi:hypothetical protein
MNNLSAQSQINALINGQEFTLPDGSTLSVWLTKGLSPHIHVMRNGNPLPGSVDDHAKKFSNAAGAILIVAVLTALLGLAAYLKWDIATIYQVTPIGAGIGAAIFGVLSRFVWRGNGLALLLAIGLYIVDTILLFPLMAAVKQSVSPGTLIFRGLLLMAMLQALPSVGAMEAEDRTSSNQKVTNPSNTVDKLLMAMLIVLIVFFAVVISVLLINRSVIPGR